MSMAKNVMRRIINTFASNKTVKVASITADTEIVKKLALWQSFTSQSSIHVTVIRFRSFSLN